MNIQILGYHPLFKLMICCMINVIVIKLDITKIDIYHPVTYISSPTDK